MKPLARTLKMVLALTLVSNLAIGCSSNAGDAPAVEGQGAKKENVTLRVMLAKEASGDKFFDWMSENMKIYTELNPQVTFDVTANASGDQYMTVLTTEMAANNVPDIVQTWASERMRPFAESGRLLDLKETLESDAEWKQFLMEDPLKATTFDGGIYGIPATLDSEIVYYNKEVFDKYQLEEPQTYDEFVKVVTTLKDNGITPMTVANKSSWIGTIPFMMIAERIGGLEMYQNVVIDKTEPWTSEPLIEAGKVLQELVALGTFEKDVNSVLSSESEAKLIEGKAGMFATGTWMLPKFSEKMGDNLGYFNFPDIEGGKGSKDHFIMNPNVTLSVAKDSKHKEEAIDFMKFVFSQERQAELAKQGFFTATKVEVNKEEISAVAAELHEELAKSTGSMYPWDNPLGAYMGAELNNTTQTLYIGKDPMKAFTNLQKKQDNKK
ncbi:extracellular solute-binding protein [Paenibacillus sp.]|uniref:ABC transporter substrate-binding protein n=1 Tax=Paenibacillus sp. TaxID=58172 RepID=UPI0028AE4E6A|nr:extracellular solute-binding protein [Paenibacillus sp.]